MWSVSEHVGRHEGACGRGPHLWKWTDMLQFQDKFQKENVGVVSFHDSGQT